MKSKILTTRVFVSLLLGLAAGLSVLAAAPPFPVNWQGVKAPMPSGGTYIGASAAVVGGKIYLFGGLISSESESSITTNTTQIYDPATDTWSLGAAMPTGRYLCTATVVDGKIYVIGGRTIDSSGAGGPVNANEMYDPVANVWSVKTAIPAAVRGHMAAAVDTKIYVFGGNTGTYQRTVRIYDTTTGAWSTGANMPGVRAYGGAVYVPSKSRIYVFGGDNGGTTASKYYGNAITYDPAANSWDSGSISMNDKVSVFAYALDSDANKIYVVSGEMWDTSQNADRAISPNVQVLDTATNSFTNLSNLPPSPWNRSRAAGAYVNGTLYVMGGFVSERLLDAYDTASGTWYGDIPYVPTFSVDNANAFGVNGSLYLLNGASSQNQTLVFNDKALVYDPAGKTWSSTNAINPAPRYGGVAGVSDGKIVFADGYNNAGIIGDTVLYDTSADTFTSLAPDPTPTNVGCGAVVNGSLYVFGGYDGNSDVASTRALNIASQTWSAKASLPFAIEGACAAAVGTKIYIFGGYDGSPDDNLNDNVIIYDTAADSFTTGPAMPIPVYGGAATAFGNYVLVYGGKNYYNQSATIYYRPAGFLQVLDTTTNTFTSTSGLWDRSNGQIAMIGNYLYGVGGDDNDYPADRLDIAQLSSGPGLLTATASADKTSGAPPLTVNFTGGATGGTAPYTYDWDFGDGSAHVSTQNASHTYTTADTYTAKLTVHDSASASASKSLTITVNSGALAATASADKTSGPAPLDVHFTGGATGGTAPYTYSWDFGDGSAASTDQSPEHSYAVAGSYTATLTVHDAASGTATAQVAITATSVAPPVVSSMQKLGNPFRIVVNGSNLQNGIQVLINGTPWGTIKYKNTSKIVLKGGSSLKAVVPKNTQTHFTFENPDGGEVEMDWQWP